MDYARLSIANFPRLPKSTSPFRAEGLLMRWTKRSKSLLYNALMRLCRACRNCDVVRGTWKHTGTGIPNGTGHPQILASLCLILPLKKDSGSLQTPIRSLRIGHQTTYFQSLAFISGNPLPNHSQCRWDCHSLTVSAGKGNQTTPRDHNGFLQ